MTTPRSQEVIDDLVDCIEHQYAHELYTLVANAIAERVDFLEYTIERLRDVCYDFIKEHEQYHDDDDWLMYWDEVNMDWLEDE